MNIQQSIVQDAFFTDISKEYDEERPDGKIVVRQKGTISMLEEWVNLHFKPTDREPIEFLFQTFRKVRKLRQKPAHAINENILKSNDRLSRLHTALSDLLGQCSPTLLQFSADRRKSASM